MDAPGGLAVLNDWADGWAGAIARASWEGGLALLAAWALTHALPRLSPAARCWLWRLAALKLLVAFCWSSPVELAVLPAAGAERSDGVVEYWSDGAGQGGAARLDPEPNSALATPSIFAVLPTPSEPNPPSFQYSTTPFSPAIALMLLWALGVGWGARRLVGEWRRLQRLLRQSQPVSDQETVAAAGELCARLGLERAPRLLAASETGSPMLTGVFRPAVVLPVGLLNAWGAAERRWVLAHELAHLRRRDLSWGWLSALAQALFFFHPLVWLAARELRLAQESACDEQALRLTGAPAGEYARLLVEVATREERGWPGGLAPAGAPWAAEESIRVLERRLQMLRRFASCRPGAGASRSSIPTPAAVAAAGAVALIGLVPWRVTAQEATAPALASVELSQPPPAAPAPPPAARVAPVPARPTSTGAVMGASPEMPLAEQWEDVLLLEALRYLRLTPAQLQQVLPLATAAEERLAKFRGEEQRTLAAMRQIARRNREALLAGQPGKQQTDVFALQRSLDQHREQAHGEIVAHVLPRLARILTRDQIARAYLLLLGEPPREPTFSAALVDPAAGFVQTAEHAVPRRDPAVEAWDHRKSDAVRQLLARRYPVALVEALTKQGNPSYMRLVTQKLTDAGIEFNIEFTDATAAVRDFTTGAPVTVGASPHDPRLVPAKQEMETLEKRADVLARQWATSAPQEELEVTLRPLVRRLFLSPRFQPVLEERLQRRGR